MLSKEISEALNDQVNAEFWSAYFYLSMYCHFSNKGLKGIAHWFKIQYEEERLHAEDLIEYIQARGNEVQLLPIAKVKSEWDSVMEAFNDTYTHECGVTKRINNLYALAEEQKDYATRQKLNWFIAEQVEEEDTVRDILDRLRLVGNDGTGLLQIDRELAGRGPATGPSTATEA